MDVLIDFEAYIGLDDLNSIYLYSVEIQIHNLFSPVAYNIIFSIQDSFSSYLKIELYK